MITFEEVKETLEEMQSVLSEQRPFSRTRDEDDFVSELLDFGDDLSDIALNLGPSLDRALTFSQKLELDEVGKVENGVANLVLAIEKMLKEVGITSL